MTYELNLLLCGLVCSQALLLGVFGVVERRASPAAAPLVGLSVAFMAYALTPLAAASGPTAFLQVTMFLESLIPVGFWYACEALFQDDFEWRPAHLLGAAAALVSLINVTTLAFPGPGARAVSDVLVDLLEGIHVACILFGLKSALRGWTHELVAVRMRVRLAVVAASGVALLGMILAKYYRVEARALDRAFPLVLNPVLLCVLLGSNVFLILHRDLLRPWTPRGASLPSGPEPVAVPVLAPALEVAMVRDEPGNTPSTTPARTGGNAAPDATPDAAIHRKLMEAMEHRGLFKTEGLTIAGLADALRVPEYRLRSHINGTLGYRNFNQYLAHYRIGLAKELLLAPSHAHEKILSIALEVGYASLAPFNKAFKDATGLTPSDYRFAAGRGGDPASPSPEAEGGRPPDASSDRSSNPAITGP